MTEPAGNRSRVLLIDGHARVRELLTSLLRAEGHTVDCAADGVAAAYALCRRSADVVLVDHSVPLGGLKVARLLRLHEERRHIPFILMARCGDQLERVRQEGAAAGIQILLGKPCTAAQLHAGVRQALSQPPVPLSGAQLRRELVKVTNVPVLSPVHRKLMALLGVADGLVDMAQLARTIQTDYGMSTLVMRICRSACYGFRGNTIEGATTFLGIDKLRKIVQAVVVLNALGPVGGATIEDGFDLMALWKHCIATGLIMEAAGQRVKGRDHFVAGLLHDVGKVILAVRFPKHFEAVLRIAREEEISFLEAEKGLLGLSHADIGYEVARKWKLPPTIATAIAFHHYPSRALQHRRLATLVHLADALARVLEIGHPGDTARPLDDLEAENLLALAAAALGDDGDGDDAKAGDVESLAGVVLGGGRRLARLGEAQLIVSPDDLQARLHGALPEDTTFHQVQQLLAEAGIHFGIRGEAIHASLPGRRRQGRGRVRGAAEPSTGDVVVAQGVPPAARGEAHVEFDVPAGTQEAAQRLREALAAKHVGLLKGCDEVLPLVRPGQVLAHLVLPEVANGTDVFGAAVPPVPPAGVELRVGENADVDEAGLVCTARKG